MIIMSEPSLRAIGKLQLSQVATRTHQNIQTHPSSILNKPSLTTGSFIVDHTNLPTLEFNRRINCILK